MVKLMGKMEDQTLSQAKAAKGKIILVLRLLCMAQFLRSMCTNIDVLNVVWRSKQQKN
jgi:hypothetical protein